MMRSVNPSVAASATTADDTHPGAPGAGVSHLAESIIVSFNEPLQVPLQTVRRGIALATQYGRPLMHDGLAVYAESAMGTLAGGHSGRQGSISSLVLEKYDNNYIKLVTNVGYRLTKPGQRITCRMEFNRATSGCAPLEILTWDRHDGAGEIAGPIHSTRFD